MAKTRRLWLEWLRNAGNLVANGEEMKLSDK